MIVQTVDNVSQFVDQFHKANRGTQFSYEALDALFYMFDELSDADGLPYELDVIAICCEYMEYESIEEALADYGHIDTLEALNDNTLVLELPSGGLVIAQV